MIAVEGNATDAKVSEPNVEHQSSTLVGDTKSPQTQVLWSWGQ